MKTLIFTSALAIAASLLPHVVRGLPQKTQKDLNEQVVKSIYADYNARGSCDCQRQTPGAPGADPKFYHNCRAYYLTFSVPSFLTFY